MLFARVVDRRRFIVGFALGSLALASGCDSASSSDTKTAVQDPAEVKKREESIKDFYKANPQKGPRGATRKP
jgi:hypothetical protein